MTSSNQEIMEDAPIGKERGSSFDLDSPFGGYENGRVFAYEDLLVPRYQEMLDTDGKAASIEKLLSYPIISAGWEIDPAKDDTGEAEFIYDALTALPHQGGPKTTIEQLISQMTMAFTFQRAYFEKVFKVNDENKIVYDKIAWRPPETCELALDARYGEPRGFRQMPVIWYPHPHLYDGPQQDGWVDIPENRAFIYTHGTWREPLLGFSQMKVPYWALAHGSKVQTPYGETNIEDIQVGDEVFGVNGSPTKVVAVHPQGVRQMYRVTFKDGRTVDCDGEHLWGIHDASRQGKYRVMSTKQIIETGLRRPNSRYRFAVPRTQAVEYSHKFVPIDPYVLGLFIGDGHISTNNYTVSIASYEADSFIVDEVASRLSDDVKLVSSKQEGNHYIRPVLSRESNPFRDAIVGLGLTGYSHERRIPTLYAEGSVKQRWDLLRGLMDSDGTPGHGTGKPSNSARYYTTSELLADDVSRLVYSLGGTAIVRHIPTRDIYCVEMLTHESPFLMPRKDKMWVSSTRRETLSIVSIEPADECECRCITVENEDGLFLTNDFLVSHNCYITKRKIRWLWYQFLENTSLPKVVVKNQDENRARSDAKKVATLKSRGVLGLDSTSEVGVLESSGKGADQFIQAMRFLDSEMSDSILAGFMDLTSQSAEGKGSYALAETASKLFLRTRRMVARDMARQITNGIIGPLIRYNFGNDASVPRFQFGALSEQNEQAVLDVFSKVATTGAKVPVEFYDQLVTRTATLLELDPGKVAKDMEVNGSPLQQMIANVDQATGLVAEATGQTAPGATPAHGAPGSQAGGGGGLGTKPFGADSVARTGAQSSTARKLRGK